MSSRASIVGSGSLMAEDFYTRKQERTFMNDDPDQMYNYYRDTLKDIRPDKPFFESDRPRYNNFSRDRLNLRHYGARVETEPFLPDGTFLDFDFLIKDPRGIAVEPDMREYRKQEEARGRFIKQGNDVDNSVPSEGWHPTKVIRDISDQFYNMKERKKIFEESMDSWHNGGTYQYDLTKARPRSCLQEQDGRLPIMRDEICYNKANVISDISNNTLIGWQQTTDNRFQVAKYGLIRPNAPLQTQDWNKNRLNSGFEHDIMSNWQDQAVPKSVSLQMIDMARKKQNDMDTGFTVFLTKSRESANVSRKLTADDLSGMQARPTDASGAPAANTLLNGQSAPMKGSQPMLDSQRMAKQVVDPFILEFMATINRKMAPREMDDLRESIEQSGVDYGIFVEAAVAAARSKGDDLNQTLWNSEANYIKGKSMKIANYSKLNVAPANDGLINTDPESYKQASRDGIQRRGQMYNDMYKPDALEYDTQYGTEVDGVKQIGSMGNKYMRHHMDREDTQDTMGDITAST